MLTRGNHCGNQIAKVMCSSFDAFYLSGTRGQGIIYGCEYQKTGNILSHSIGCLSIIIRLTEEIFVEVGRMWGVEPMTEAPYYTQLWPTPDPSLSTLSLRYSTQIPAPSYFYGSISIGVLDLSCFKCLRFLFCTTAITGNFIKSHAKISL